MSASQSDKKQSDITVYGATSFVAKHILRYLLAVTQNSKTPSEGVGSIRITLGGRNSSKLEKVKEELGNPVAIHDIFVASGSDLPLLKEMAQRTKIVINCAGPYAKHSNLVVAACAEMGADYVDITGEVYWSAVMRQKYGSLARTSGARIISLCGYDSVPSDLALFAAVEALRERKRSTPDVNIQEAKIWHQIFGMANGGTIHTAVDFEWDPLRDFTSSDEAGQQRKLRQAPFFVGDPLQLTNPEKVRFNPDFKKTKDNFAMSEWWNQLISIDREFSFGVSLPMPMSAINLKVLHASSVALGYGPDIQIRERFVPLGYVLTRIVGIFALIPMICMQIVMLWCIALFRIPHIGKKILDVLTPPGSGAPDWMVNMGSNSVYAVVTANVPEDEDGVVDRGYAHLKFQGEAGNAVTAQCVSESALALLLDRDSLPVRSEDGFGTPAELLGHALLKRFRETTVRPVEIHTIARTRTSKNEMKLYMG